MNPNQEKNSIWTRIHLDPMLLGGLLALMATSCIVLWSAGGQDSALLIRQCQRMGAGLVIMLILAQIRPETFKQYAPPIFIFGALLLIAVLTVGHVGKGAQRWLDVGVFKFQPSEIMKLFMPLMIAWFVTRQPLPVRLPAVALALLLVLVPTLMIARQPDLGTSLLVAASGIFVIFLAGMSWRLVGAAIVMLGAFLPVLWFFLMHPYQRQRVLTFLNPESDPLGSGYHIIQSKIAIGSGGLWGKGWLHGTQSQLDFLPERHTDFIFSVYSEEFGFVGVALLMALYVFVIGRGLVIASQAQGSFARLVAGSITLTFFVYVLVNVGMVSGLLPVVGVPLPLISYGGTSIVTLMAGFGILMSAHTHKRSMST